MGNRVFGWLTTFGQGLAIGVANVIPGVSGGTMALIFGIYEKLISLLSDLFQASLALVRFDFKTFKGLLSSVSWGFLVLLILGILVAPLTGAALIPDLLDTWPEHSRSLFFGLILGTIPIPWIRMSSPRVAHALVLVLSAAISFYLVGLPPTEISDPSLVAVFFSAALAICAMILPGVSGAFVLLVIGMYAPIFEAIDQRNLAVIAVFALGAGVGLGSFAVVLKYLLEKAHDWTMAALVGLMAGSLRALWPWLESDRSLALPTSWQGQGWVIALGLLGLLVSVGMTVLELRSAKHKANASAQ